MRKIIALMLVLSIVLLVGCQTKSYTVTSNDGTETKVDINAKNTDSWCAAGSEWQSTNTDAKAKMVVVGIESSGKYKDYCHVTYDVDSDESQAEVDFYFKEDGSGYQIMNVNGQTFESEWTAPEE